MARARRRGGRCRARASVSGLTRAQSRSGRGFRRRVQVGHVAARALTRLAARRRTLGTDRRWAGYDRRCSRRLFAVKSASDSRRDAQDRPETQGALTRSSTGPLERAVRGRSRANAKRKPLEDPAAQHPRCDCGRHSRARRGGCADRGALTRRPLSVFGRIGVRCRPLGHQDVEGPTSPHAGAVDDHRSPHQPPAPASIPAAGPSTDRAPDLHSRRRRHARSARDRSRQPRLPCKRAERDDHGDAVANLYGRCEPVPPEADGEFAQGSARLPKGACDRRRLLRSHQRPDMGCGAERDRASPGPRLRLPAG